MGKLTIREETSDPVQPDEGRLTLYAKDGAWYARDSDGNIRALAGSQILFGAGAPSSGLGIIGDFYEDTSNGDVYKKTGAATWTLQDNLTGPQGIQGVQGIQGPPGSLVPASDVAPAEVSDSTASAGTGGAVSREDHVHAHGNRGGGSLHAAATTSVAGFLSASDKTRIDGIEILADAQINAQKGVANGLATLDVSGKVPSIQLPSYVDDVLEYANLAAFPVTGESGKIYIALDTGKTYRWSGSIYVEISPSEVTSVNGQTGIVNLTTSNISEGTNLYFTNARADARITAARGVANGIASLDGSTLLPSAQHGNYSSPTHHAVATVSAAGFMSAADKTKLDAQPSLLQDFVFEDDMLSGSELTQRIGKFGWELAAGGTGNNATRVAGEPGRPGIFRIQGGTVATARAGISLGAAGANPVSSGASELYFDAMFRLTGVVTTHLQSAVGLGDSFAANGDQTNGIYIRVLGTGGNWELVCANGGVRTSVVLGAYVSGAWVRMGFRTNAAWTSIQGTVSGVDVGLPITTNIPAVALSPFAKTDAIAGGTALGFDIDKIYIKQALSR